MTCSACNKNNDINLGTRVKIKARLTTDDLPVDSATVNLKLLLPNGTEQPQAVTFDGDGTYTAEITVNQPGQWRYQFFAPETGAVEEGGFIVRRSAFA